MLGIPWPTVVQDYTNGRLLRQEKKTKRPGKTCIKKEPEEERGRNREVHARLESVQERYFVEQPISPHAQKPAGALAVATKRQRRQGIFKTITAKRNPHAAPDSTEPDCREHVCWRRDLMHEGDGVQMKDRTWLVQPAMEQSLQRATTASRTPWTCQMMRGDERGLECEWKVHQGAVSVWPSWLAAVKLHWWAGGETGRDTRRRLAE